MYPKARNTLIGLAVAAGMMMLSYGLGAPPQAPVGPGNITLAGANLIVVEDGNGTALAAVHGDRKSSHGLKRQIAMPYFSFGQLLPHRES